MVMINHAEDVTSQSGWRHSGLADTSTLPPGYLPADAWLWQAGEYAGCEGESGVGEGEESADCEGPESVVLLGREGVGGAHVFHRAQAVNIRSICERIRYRRPTDSRGERTPPVGNRRI